MTKLSGCVVMIRDSLVGLLSVIYSMLCVAFNFTINYTYIDSRTLYNYKLQFEALVKAVGPR